MSQPFDGSQGLIIVPARVAGAAAAAVLHLALDTGATRILINTPLLATLGYDPERVEVTTGSGIEFAPLVTVQCIDALGFSKLDFPVLAYTLPPTVRVDGVLGLDFLRSKILTINFKTGVLGLES